jgi:hypothetical protein
MPAKQTVCQRKIRKTLAAKTGAPAHAALHTAAIAVAALSSPRLDTEFEKLKGKNQQQVIERDETVQQLQVDLPQ